MSEMPEMSKYSRGTESFQQFAIRIADMLLEPEKFRELYGVVSGNGKYSTLRIFTPTSFNDIQHGIFA